MSAQTIQSEPGQPFRRQYDPQEPTRDSDEEAPDVLPEVAYFTLFAPEPRREDVEREYFLLECD